MARRIFQSVIFVSLIFAALALSPLVPAARAAEPDTAAWNKVVSQHVDNDGFVDYDALASDTSDLNAFVASLGKIDLSDMDRNAKLATLINAYNAFTVRLILDNYDDGDLDSIKDIPAAKRWDAKRWNLGGKKVSLNQIEHEMIRPEFVQKAEKPEPRIHWALVCAAVSCPPLRNEAYTGEKLKDQLADQEKYVFSHKRYYQPDPEDESVSLTRILDWYGSDFVKSGEVLPYVNKHTRQDLSGFSVDWLDYDWDLNSKANKPGA